MNRQNVSSAVAVPVSRSKQAIALLEFVLFALAFVAVFTFIVQANNIQL